jgi:hypothetical protein
MSLLPDKQLRVVDSVIGKSALLLSVLDRPRSVTDAWERSRTNDFVRSFDQFVLALDLLFMMNAVEYSNGLLRRKSAHAD